MTCEVCNDRGFVRCRGEVTPCPACNPDSGWEPGEYLATLVAKKGRCDYARGGGGRTCYREKGHKPPHRFECGR